MLFLKIAKKFFLFSHLFEEIIISLKNSAFIRVHFVQAYIINLISDYCRVITI